MFSTASLQCRSVLFGHTPIPRVSKQSFRTFNNNRQEIITRISQTIIPRGNNHGLEITISHRSLFLYNAIRNGFIVKFN